MPSIPREEIDQRIERLQLGLDQLNLNGTLIVQTVDLYYFSGTAQDSHLLIPTQGDPILLVRKDFSRAQEDSPLDDIRSVASFSDLRDTIISSLGSDESHIGMELDVLPVNNYFRYKKILDKAEIHDISNLIKEIRMIKSPLELRAFQKAAEMNDSMFAYVPEVLKEGLTEIEFAGFLEAYYRRMGHQGIVRVRGFNNQVFFGHIMSGNNLAVPSCSVGPTGGPGPNPSIPHGAGIKKITRNEPIQVDYVGVVDGYMVDQARTFYLGEVSKNLSKIHDKALEIQNTIAELAKPGARADDLYNTSIRMAEEAGLLEGFLGYPQPVPFVGHGVGLELDEFPVLGKKSPHIIEKGMVIAIEPKFIVPEQGLAGIENTFVVTEHGLEKLTKFDDQIQIVN